MSRAQLEASRALWLGRERYRYAKWRHYHKGGDSLRGKWWKLYSEAHDQRMRRDHQLAALVDRPRTISDSAVATIAGFEGFVAHPYKDAVGVWTIGYGHTAGVGPNTPHLTQKQAQALLRRDLERIYVPPVRKWARLLNQQQFDALVSLVYNVGPGVLQRGHSLGDALAAGNLRAAGDSILLYDHAGARRLPGLTRRRQAEHRLFFSGGSS
jgi:lysozyme